MLRSALSYLFLLIYVCDAASKESLNIVARKAHEVIPELRRRELERRQHLEKKLIKSSNLQTRDLEDRENDQYFANQYNGFQYGKYQEWDPCMAEQEFGFDITKYSFKYTGCHDVGRTYSSDGNPSRYATFRLCPTEACSGRSTWGCKSDYGEYIVPVDLLVASLIEHNQARVMGYCEYCQNCAAIDSYTQFATEVLLHKQYVLSYAQKKFSTWCAQNGYSTLSADDDGIYQTASNALWKEMRNKNYASNYVSQSYGGQTYASNAYGQANARQSWNLKGGYSQSSQYNEQAKSWQNMGSTFGTWYDYTIFPGYHDYNTGQFVACWGYNSQAYGFICIDQEDSIFWDEQIFGQIPETWEELIDEDGFIVEVDQEEICDNHYSSSCYNQYDACMEILSDQQSNSYGSNSQSNKFSLGELLECAQIPEELMQYSALSFYDQYVYAQQRNRKYAANQNGYNWQYGENQEESGNKYQYAQNDDSEYEIYFYVGLACSSDGVSIKLAVYGDEYCTERVGGISVKELLGYNPLADNMSIFPDDCISCNPTEGELLWYETEEVDDPVLPFCSMLYQLADKCNTQLKPSGRYDPSLLYAYNSASDYFMVDSCTMVESLNKEIVEKQSWMKKWADDVRMTRKSMSPGAKAGFVLTTLFLAGLIVAGCMYGNMRAFPSRRKESKPDIIEVPDFKYQNAEFERKDSGVERARGGRSMFTGSLKLSRCRTLPQGL